MNQASLDSIVDAGRKIYESLRPKLEPAFQGKYIVIDVDSGHYEIDADRMAASDRAHAQRPQGHFYVERIGIPFRIRRPLVTHPGTTQ